MSALRSTLIVMRKELRDLFRDHRTLALALVMGPLLYPAMMVGIGALAESRAKEQTEKPLQLPVAGAAHAPNLIAWLEGQNVVVQSPPKDIDAAIADQSEDVILRIGSDFPEQWRKSLPAPVEIIQDSTRRDAEIPVQRLQGLLEAYGRQVGALRLIARGISPAAGSALQLKRTDLASAEAKRGILLSTLLPYLLILTAFLGGSYLILDATAGERERQSLEPLLATPAGRGSIVSGKIAAACAMGLATLLLTLLAFKLTAQFAPALAKQLDVRMIAIAKMLLVLLPMLFIGTTLLTLLAASAKSVKEAQSHMMWLMMLPIIPTVMLMVNPLKNELWQFAVPFLAQNQMLLKIIRGEGVSPLEWGAYLTAGFGLALLLWYAAVRRYHQEKLAISA